MPAGDRHRLAHNGHLLQKVAVDYDHNLDSGRISTECPLVRLTQVRCAQYRIDGAVNKRGFQGSILSAGAHIHDEGGSQPTA